MRFFLAIACIFAFSAIANATTICASDGLAPGAAIILNRRFPPIAPHNDRKRLVAAES
jgi:hypothetical protein